MFAAKLKVCLSAGISVAAMTGCKCESNSHKPYTPFGVATDLGPAASGAPVERRLPDSGAAHRFTPIEGERLTPPSPSVRVGEWKVRAPEGMLIAQYVAVDLDKDGKKEAVAWVVPQNDARGQAVAQLTLFREDQPNQTLQGFPGFVPLTPECSLTTRLTATGPSTVTWDVEADCPVGATIPRAPTRSVAIIAPLHPNPVRLQLRLASPPPSEQLQLEVDTSDQDGDGHDDAVIVFRLMSVPPAAGSDDSPPTNTAHRPGQAKFVWLDRAAGMARDTSEPQQSFADMGSVETVRAKGPTTSRLVAQRISNARRLFAYLCRESGTYRLTDSDGAAFTCGNLRRAFDWYATADVRAALTQNNPARALLAFEQGSWFGSGMSAKVDNELARDIRAAITTEQASAHFLDAKALTPSPGPHFSPLRYVEDDALLIATDDGIWRWHRSTLADASDEVDPWPLVVFSPDGQRLTQLSFPCNEPTIAASSQTQTGAFDVALTTDILSPRPGVCDGRGNLPELDFRPTAWATEGLSAFLGPIQVGPTPRFRQPGSPQSPNGDNAVARTKLGLLVLTRGRAAFWDTRLDETQLSDCVISNSAAHLACLQGTRVVELTAQPKPSGVESK